MILGLGRSPGEGKGYPLQHSGLGNSMDYTVHGVAKSWTRLSDFHFLFDAISLWRFQSIWLGMALGWVWCCHGYSRTTTRIRFLHHLAFSVQIALQGRRQLHLQPEVSPLCWASDGVSFCTPGTLPVMFLRHLLLVSLVVGLGLFCFLINPVSRG